jgi:hypothetical protein
MASVGPSTGRTLQDRRGGRGPGKRPLGFSNGSEQAHAPLTAREAQRAIYIDFEGRENEPPAFFGVLCVDDDQNQFDQYVIDQGLWPAAEAKDADPKWLWRCLPATWADLSEIRNRAESEDRRIIAFSEREQKAVAEHMPDDADRDWFVTNIVNARPIAVAWKAEFYPEVVFKKDPNRRSRGINRLELFLELIGYDVPPIHGSGNSAARILYVRDKLTSRQGDPSSQDKVDQWPQTQPLRL